MNDCRKRLRLCSRQGQRRAPLNFRGLGLTRALPRASYCGEAEEVIHHEYGWLMDYNGGN
jgi:hypothetical protein